MFCGALLQAQRSPLENAWDLLRNGDRPAAIRLLRQFVHDHPADADARLLLGSVLMEEGRRDESIAQLTEAVRLRPNSAEVQNALGEAYNAFDDPKSARAPLEKAVALDPKFAVAHVNLGTVLLQTGNMDPAAAHLDRAIALLGNTRDAAEPMYLRAKVYTDHGEVDKAAAALRKAVSLRPDFAEAWSDLGDAQRRLSDSAGALNAFRRAVEIKPDDEVAQTRLATELLSQGQAHEAALHFEEAVRLSPSDQSALNGLQRALRADGQTARADEVKKRLTELLRRKDTDDQNSLVAIRLNNEGAALEKAGDLHGALEKYRAALALWPDHVGIRINIAAALLHLGQWNEGVAELREVLRRDPSNEQVKAALNEALAHPPPH
jgi:tetratricopeptide (TPR) repeat protein